MKLSEISKKEQDMADIMFYELSKNFDINYDDCIKVAKKIYDKLWW